MTYIAPTLAAVGLPSHEGSGLKLRPSAARPAPSPRLPSHEGSGLKWHTYATQLVAVGSPLA